MTDNPYAPPGADIEPPADNETALASRGSRLAASIIDSVVMMLIWLPLFMLSGYWDAVTSGQAGAEVALMAGLMGTVIYLLINGYFLHTRGQSLGKMALKIQIVSRETGRIVSLGRLVGLRIAPVWLASLIPLVGDFASLIDVLFIFRKDRRCIHDMIANTQVIACRPA